MTNYAKWALLAALLAMPVFSTSAAENNGETKQNTASSAIKTVAQSTTFGGYVIGSASLNNQEDAVHSNFQLRLARLYAKGKIGDFAYQLQMQVNGIGGSAGEKGPRIVDAWGEWQHFSFARIKFGQFKRAFLFENPMNPWDISFGAYSQITTKLSGMSDRCGEHDSNGRDIGIQLQGDLVPTADHSRHFIHYQIGLWTGNGINHADNNSHKDLMGGIYLMPLKGLKVGAWGWNGRYTSSTNITVDRKRWAAGFAYDGIFTARGEYAHSYGYKVSDYNAENNTWKNSNKSEGWYIMAGAPVTRDKRLRIYAKVDSYSDYLHLDYSTTKNIYGLTAEYWFMKNLKLQLNANTINDKATTHKGLDGKYSTLDLQLYWRF